MKRFAPSLFLLLAGLNTTAARTVERPAWKRHFDAHGVAGTFVLYEPATNLYTVYDPERARHGYLPALTFTIPMR